MSFIDILSGVHDRFMWMVHEIFHAMFDIKENRFYCGIHLATEAQGEILKSISILDSDVNDSTNAAIKGFSVLFLNSFKSSSNERCSQECCLFL